MELSNFQNTMRKQLHILQVEMAHYCLGVKNHVCQFNDVLQQYDNVGNHNLTLKVLQDTTKTQEKSLL